MSSPELQKTDIRDVGEFGLIRRLKEIAEIRVDDPVVHDRLRKGISDDCAVFTPAPGKVQLLTTDALIEGVHFDLTYTSMKHLGWKSIVTSVSDIAAMGGQPKYAVVTLALPQKISVEMAEDLYMGASHACKKYSCLIVGGDTVASLTNMMISVTMTGEAVEQRLLYRSGARPGDVLCVSGHLGASVAGLKILQREKTRYSRSASPASFEPKLDAYREVIEKHLMPSARMDLARIFAEEVGVHAAIDISDGLASEVHHLCAQSGSGAAVWEHNLPVIAATQQVAAEFGESATDYALHGGEEFELLFALPESDFVKLERLTNDVTVIGRVTEASKGVTYIREDGQEEPLHAAGWNHFRAVPPPSPQRTP